MLYDPTFNQEHLRSPEQSMARRVAQLDRALNIATMTIPAERPAPVAVPATEQSRFVPPTEALINTAIETMPKTKELTSLEPATATPLNAVQEPGLLDVDQALQQALMAADAGVRG